MSSSRTSTSIIGRRLRERRELLGWSLERVGVEIGLDESSARARISRYELGVHQPAEETALRLARALQVPHAFLQCEDERLAQIILAASALSKDHQDSLLASLQQCLEHHRLSTRK